MRVFRYWLGRHLIYAGLLALPQGRCRTEIAILLGAWGRKLRAVLAEKKA